MACKIVFVVGDPTISDQYILDGLSDAWDDRHHFRLFVCDTEEDLPSDNILNGDFAIIKNPHKFFFADNSEWNEVLGQQGEQGPQGELGNSIYAWPIHSVFFTDDENTNPNTLLGFGTWSSLGQIPSLQTWGWKRTA